MYILLYDRMQETDAPAAIKSVSLADNYSDAVSFDISYSASQTFDCLGIGNTDATEVYISSTDGEYTDRTIEITQDYPFHNGLYRFTSLTSSSFTISHNGTFIGRVGIGACTRLCTDERKELGFFTTEVSRKTLSGQILPGAGGYSGRRLDLDVRYEIDEAIYEEIHSAYSGQIAKQFPFFLLLDEESHKLPGTLLRFYAFLDDPEILLQSSVRRFLYSYKFEFREAF